MVPGNDPPLFFSQERDPESSILYPISLAPLKDVMMAHPDAWGFPDTSRVVAANPGEPVNPFHGWYAQHSIDPEAELEDVETLGPRRNGGRVGCWKWQGVGHLVLSQFDLELVEGSRVECSRSGGKARVKTQSSSPEGSVHRSKKGGSVVRGHLVVLSLQHLDLQK